ncbi:low-density lipoprotein receptor-related protein 12-like isoform X2 [Ptychodera flava]|uniref:low-density lipoprotein receptor-related protein 12-like isoform X2 n=1 Tax=Ptychodera flava TaxID=63121 RepID=UPI003969FEC6
MVIVTSCPNQRVSTAFTVLLLFLSTVESDDSVYYMTELCDQTLTPTHDRILSHRGEMYKGYFDCVLVLKTEHKNQSIAIDYDWYDMQKVGKVCVDYLAIYDGDTLEPADLLHKICGRDDNPMTPTVFSTGSTLTLRLFTTSWVSGREFSLKVSAVEYHKDCGEGMYHCDNHRCIDQSLVCDDRNNCGDNSDESYCQIETKSNKSDYMTELCDQTLTPTHDDRILSHEGEMFNHYVDCVLVLKTENKHQSIAIDYDRYDIRKVGKVCSDYLAIYDGESPDPSHLLDRICGYGWDRNPMTPTVYSTGSTLTLRFFSTSWISGREFSLKVSAVEYRKDCGEGMYHCDNDRCINESLVCDDRNNCGDNSDESYCQNSDKSGTIMLIMVFTVGGVVILTVLLLLVLGVVHLVNRSRRYDRCSPRKKVPYVLIT